MKSTHPHANKQNLLPVAGIGASAGGLEALEIFFSNIHSNSGFAFIVVTHQQPGHVSLLPELLHHSTDMPVISIEDGMMLQANHVFVCPPGKNLAVYKHKFHLMDLGKFNSANLPIDYFLRSLAEDIQEMSVGIILSGTGTDGTLGLKAIKGVSGITIVQDPKTAKFDGMPSSAILMGDVDFVLPADQIGPKLIQYYKGPFYTDNKLVEPKLLVAMEPMQKIFLLLRNRTGNDFSAYKPNTIQRRIARRMNIHQLNNPDRYVQFLQENPVEIDKLSKELLINVTNFFRDADAFNALSEIAFPKLFADKPDNYEFRVWVTGCSSGEEAYTIAILFKEAIDKNEKPFRFQIFATDLDESSITRARDGLFPAGIAADVSAVRLERFFKLDNNQYRINKEIRERVIFANQNLIQDPPFTHIDLLSCRNVLIYINQELQKEILANFHYALNPDGILILGSSESIGNFEDRFIPIDKKWKIYQRKNVRINFPISKLGLSPSRTTESATEPFKLLSTEYQTGNIARQIERLLLERYAPVSVIINEHGKIIYIHGRTGQYLEPSSGQPNWNIVEMAREGLRLPLMASLNKATKDNETEIKSNGIRIKNNGNFEIIDMILTRITESEPLRDLFLVSFLPCKLKEDAQLPAKQQTSEVISSENLEKEQLQQELYFTKESLRLIIEQQQAFNEEIKSSNEELQSTNEELQSSNEELETSKEEMQSLNEELSTVNSELQNKIERLSEINDDMQNLMNNTDIATIFLDNQLRIKRFTRQAKDIFNLIENDIGRPLADLASILKYAYLMDDAKSVLQTLVNKDMEVQTLHDDWYLLRILPYRTSENMIDGLVITFVNITRIKKAEHTAQAAEITTAIVNTINQPLIVLDDQLLVLTVNPAYEQVFNSSHDPLAGLYFFEMHAAAWNSPLLRAQLTRTIATSVAFDRFYLEIELPSIGKKHVIINGRILKQSPVSPALILLAINDASDGVKNDS